MTHRHGHRGLRRTVAALLLGTVVAAGPTVASAQDGGGASGGEPATTITLASGIDGVGLAGATDDLDNGSPLEVRAVKPTFGDVYTLIDGAELITDRWSSDGQQGRSWATDLGAKVANKPIAAFEGGRYFDFGANWYSKRTFRATVEIPAGRTVGASSMMLMADNNVEVRLVNSGGSTVVVEANCDTFEACNSDEGQKNFRVGQTKPVNAAAFRAGTNTFEFTVEDWGTVVGLQFKVTIDLQAGPPTCSSGDPAVSCSLTVAILSNLPAGTARYCYASTDGVPRTFRVPTAEGVQVYTLSSGTWVDAPVPSGDVVFYPVEDAPLPFASITDPTLARCPGAVPTTAG